MEMLGGHHWADLVDVGQEHHQYQGEEDVGLVQDLLVPVGEHEDDLGSQMIEEEMSLQSDLVETLEVL